MRITSNVNTDSGKTRKVFTMNQNRRSRWAGICTSTGSAVMRVRSDRSFMAFVRATWMLSFVRFSEPITFAVFGLYPARIAAWVAFKSMRNSLTKARCFGVDSQHVYHGWVSPSLIFSHSPGTSVVPTVDPIQVRIAQLTSVNVWALARGVCLQAGMRGN